MTALGKLLRTTAFKLTLVYLTVFALFASFLLVYFAWNTRRLITEQITQTVDAEITGLAEQYRQGGIRRLVGKLLEDKPNLDRRCLSLGMALAKSANVVFAKMAVKHLDADDLRKSADRFLFNKPETVLTMTLKGPGTSTQGAIDAFNEVFGA